METEWQRWFYRDLNDSRLSAKQLDAYLPPIYSNLESLSTTFKFDTSLSDSTWYEETKNFVFENYATPKMLINNLLKLCNSRYNLKFSYESFKSNLDWVLPDNKLYRFVVEECTRRRDIYNKLIIGDK